MGSHKALGLDDFLSCALQSKYWSIIVVEVESEHFLYLCPYAYTNDNPFIALVPKSNKISY